MTKKKFQKEVPQIANEKLSITMVDYKAALSLNIHKRHIWKYISTSLYTNSGVKNQITKTLTSDFNKFNI